MRFVLKVQRQARAQLKAKDSNMNHYERQMTTTFEDMMKGEKTKKQKKTKKQVVGEKLQAAREENLSKLASISYRIIATRHALIQNHLQMNWLECRRTKREEPENVYTEEEESL